MKYKTSVVFPGQGSQEVGMLSDFSSSFPLVRRLFETASKRLGYDLWEVVQNGPAEVLNKTTYTQPALLVADVAIWNVIQSGKPIVPSIMAGHSLGEYAALVAAEALAFEEAVFLVDKRAKLMQEAVPEGIGSTAVILGLSSEEVKTLCQAVSTESDVVSAVNYNAPVQTVIAGKKEAVNQALELAKQKGAKKIMVLPISIPVHCELMRPMAADFSVFLNQITIKTPRVPVLHNVDVCSYEHPDDIRAALARQLYSPVRWVETIERMKSDGIQTIIESGPKSVLAGLIKRIDQEFNLFSMSNVENLKQYNNSEYSG